MRQQINLYQAVLIDKAEPLQSTQVRTLMLLFVVLLALLSGIGYWQLRDAKRQVMVLEQQKANLEARVVELEEKYPVRQKSALLETEIARARELLAGQKELLGYFSGRDDEQSVGFTKILDGLARHRSRGVWLSNIQLDAGGENISLAGSALQAEQVPQYIASLSEKGVLGGQVFSRLKLVRMTESPGQVDFSLKASGGGE